MTDPDPELELELEAEAAVAGPAVAAVRKVIAQITAMFENMRVTGPALLEFIRKALATIRVRGMDARLEEYAGRARALGIAQAMRSPLVSALDGKAVDWTAGDVPGLDAMLDEGIREAAKLAGAIALETKADVMSVIGLAGKTAAGLKGETRRVVNEEINQGTAEVARAMGLNLLWVPERNACLDCLAHAGWVVEVGKAFPPVSFDPDAKNVWTVLHPPLHPHCRCRVRLTDAKPGRPATTDPLAREARRAVVYQQAESESGAALRRAATALLDRGASLPKSVEERARRTLKDAPARSRTPVGGPAALAAVGKGLPVRGSLSRSQRTALKDYESSAFVGINGALRRGLTDASQRTLATIGAIDSAMTPATTPIEVWRGVQDAGRMFGALLDADMTGTEWEDLAYTSTTATAAIAQSFTSGSADGGRVLMRIVAPAGTPAVVISDEGYLDQGQAEILLARGQRFRVVADLGVDDRGVRRLDVQVVR